MREAKGIEAFTLIEMMLVVVIIGILAAVVMPRVINARTEALKNAAKADVSSFALGVDMYLLDVGQLPADLKDLVVDPGVDKWAGPYLKEKRIPKDGWGSRYVFKKAGERAVDYEIYSLGPDGLDGTDDDIGNWVKVDDGE